MRKREWKTASRSRMIDAGELCRRKKRFSETEASALALKWGQIKYKCQVCEQWHLKNVRGNDE